MADLPAFTCDGVLPLGDYALTLMELRSSYLVDGPSPTPTWDRAWRRSLLDHFEQLVGDLWQCGVERIFVSGSFVESSDHPKDLDGYFECDEHDFLTGTLQRRLNAVNPGHIWTWDASRKYRSDYSTKSQLPMWHVHRADLWPHYGRIGGETDSYGYDMLFPSLFRRTKHRPGRKGIIQVIRQR